jgi:protein kinase-like protein
VATTPDIPGHKVGGVLGRGGYATVYRAWQVAVGREVAVKVDNRLLLGDRDRRRFMREVTAAGRLSGHPHVIDVYDAGTLGDGRPYLVMELCPAGSLSDALRRHGPMSPAQVRDIGIKIADALAAAHAGGILHRDIKPANILVNRYGMVGLSDFGLASIIAASGDQTASREALTPAYASPESFHGEEPAPAGDLYSLAATLYALLAGRPPRFPADGRSPSPAMIMALHDQPVDDVPGAPAELMGLLRRGLAADPAVRPHSAIELRDTLIHGDAWLPAPRGRDVAADPWQAAARRPNGPPPRQASAAPAAEARLHPAGDGAPDAGAAGPRPAQARRPGRSATPPAVGGRGGHAADPRSGGDRRDRRPIALVAAIIVIAGAAALLGARFLAHRAGAGPGGTGAARTQGSGTRGGTPNVFGVPTVTAGCPAASVRVAGARCPARPECWAGMVETSGAVTDRSLPCTRPHYWETFAIAILPADARTFDQPTLERNPTVSAVCSMRILLASRRGRALRIPVSAWRVDVLPPTEAAFDSGTRTYRCVANVNTRQPRTSLFSR